MDHLMKKEKLNQIQKLLLLKRVLGSFRNLTQEGALAVDQSLTRSHIQSLACCGLCSPAFIWHDLEKI